MARDLVFGGGRNKVPLPRRCNLGALVSQSSHGTGSSSDPPASPPPALRSARDHAAPSGESPGHPPRQGKRGRDGGSRGGKRGKKKDAPAKPIPARALGTTLDAPGMVEPDLLEGRILVDGVAWSARVIGRSGGSGPGATPLLLLGFWNEARRADCAEDAEGPLRESLVVARALSELSEADLEAAFSTSAPPRPFEGPKSVFAGTEDKRRR